MRPASVLLPMLVASCVGDARLVPTGDAGPPLDDRRFEGAVSPAEDAEQDERAAGRVDDASRGTGDASLVLRLVDDESGAPVATRVRLWRLDVPADAAWGAGDHVQRVVALPAAPARIDRLPVGRYRLQIDGQRRGAADPPEFVVGSGATTKEFRVTMPRKFHVRLVVVDENGRRLTEGRVAVGLVSGHTKSDPSPPWAHQRRRSGNEDPPGGTTLIADGRGVLGHERKGVVAGPDGFDLGEFPESSRSSGGDDEAVVEFADRAGVSVFIRSSLGVDTTFYGVSVPTADVFAHVEKPDGSRVDLAQAAYVDARCDAVDSAAAARDRWWRDAPFSASLQVSGFDYLAFTWRLTTTDERYVLKPAKK